MKTIILIHLSKIAFTRLLPIFVLLILSWQGIAAPISDQLNEIGTEQMEVETENDEIEELEFEVTMENQASWALDISPIFLANSAEYFVSLAVPDSPPELL